MTIDKPPRSEGSDAASAAARQPASPIAFRLDPASGVPTYLQLVQQVEHALRLGYLKPGDQLPKVLNAVETNGLGKRYGNAWALRECTLAIPAGHVAALVGPNGAGKSTLLNLVVGLAAPSAGIVTVLDGQPAGSAAALDGIAFVAQDAPLYRNLTPSEMLRLTRNLNRRFDEGYAKARLRDLGIPLERKAAQLSGGQQSQLALSLALARRPQLLVLDEPIAMLDPLARHDFMSTAIAAIADDGLSVLLSSHVLTELERVADFLVLVAHRIVQVAR